MTARRLLVRGGQLLVACLAVAVLLGLVLGQPVLLSYVETGSMAPTLQPGDGFVAVPAALAGPVEPGDVVTYRAERLQGGGLTTHRVVAVTDAGYVTKGDANAVTDQESVEPPVREEQVVATALAVGGDVLVLPGVGRVVTGIRGLAAPVATALGLGAHAGLVLVLGVLGVALYLVGTVRADRRPTREGAGPSLDGNALVLALVVLVVAVTTASVVLPAGATRLDVVSADTDAPGPRVIEAGTTETTNYSLRNPGLVPVVAFLEAPDDAVAVTPDHVSVEGTTATNATVSITAPPATGYYRYALVEDRYLAVLPTSVLAALRGIHPWLPILVVDALVAGPVLLVGRVLVARGGLAARTRPVPLRVRLRRWVR
ncbi:signal peptidase I [Halorientalis halophila]|uniref:signal peptidase I n=1 Tax=Halorientalis halophila TaxID=3108499 RepID=UPI00300A6DC1